MNATFVQPWLPHAVKWFLRHPAVEADFSSLAKRLAKKKTYTEWVSLALPVKHFATF